ncbi:diguanylate cyclase (GGDEF) domain-containing protein [Amphritea atlantica]|uniref:diguanylate cyclase n=1 Tax=Amphritea atlantica TaxID=355243 RepID=A0A1H9D7Q7_9GAMM|nr:GGDEF domain-containing protein [Amphritea atlantica]SEQ09411.1 diguanylate cyclase (GGDEF) domain-containing protein [Amphritea atlantica]
MIKSSAELPDTLIGGLRFLLFPNRDFLQKKYEDHRRFTIIVSAFLSVLWAALWGWDWVTDPVGADNTRVLRLLFLAALAYSLTLYFIRKSSAWLAIITVVGMLAAEANFILILNHLDNGIVYGLGGFMYCMFIAVLVFQCFSLITNIIYTLSATLLPHLAGELAIADNFQHFQYAALIWPAALLAIVAQIVQSHHYLLRYQLERQLEALSTTDTLTGARNRRYFIPLLAREVRRAKRTGQKLSLLMLDIDMFKRVNDTYGHLTGDRVIHNVSVVSHQFARDIDVVARLGGEEFAILLTACDQNQAVQVAERIRSEIKGITMHSEDDISFNYTVSIGVAELDESDQNERCFLGRADSALYKAKESGRNRVVLAEDEKDLFNSRNRALTSENSDCSES